MWDAQWRKGVSNESEGQSRSKTIEGDFRIVPYSGIANLPRVGAAVTYADRGGEAAGRSSTAEQNIEKSSAVRVPCAYLGCGYMAAP